MRKPTGNHEFSAPRTAYLHPVTCSVPVDRAQGARIPNFTTATALQKREAKWDKIKARIFGLKNRLVMINRMLKEEYHYPRPDTGMIKNLKATRLRIKDELHAIYRAYPGNRPI